ISASETPKSRFDTRSFPPVSIPAPVPKPLSNRSCCHLPQALPAPASPTLLYGAGRFLPPRVRTAPRPPPRPLPAGLWLRLSLMISSRDMSILSPIAAMFLKLTFQGSPLPPPQRFQQGSPTFLTCGPHSYVDWQPK
uniref:Uncharacterized protein n=1 Tax=Xenopus tropicalis TaxID=8364 RepID=A0A803K0C3_XENTR